MGKPTIPDAKTPHEALAALSAAILAVPDDALDIGSSFGKRNESVGGGWYWSVSWRLGIATGNNNPLPVDKAKVLAKVVEDALLRIAEESE